MSRSVDGITRKIYILLESLGKEKSIWEHYNEMAAVDDNIRAVEWRDLADTVLVFVCTCALDNIWLLIWLQDGLFAAFLSAFLIFMIPQLQPSSTDATMDVLIHISQQLSNSTTPAFVPTPFQVSSNAAVVNMLFLLSLAFVLIDAFLAMLVKGWLQEFDRGWRKCTVAHLRAQERERRLQELELWGLDEFVALLPIFIQIALVLFCIGMLLFIFPLHLPSAILCTSAFVSVVVFYGFTTYVSILNNYAPFSSPLSRLLAHSLKGLRPRFARHTRRIAAFVRFRQPLLPQAQQSDADSSRETTQSLHSNRGVTQSMQLHNLDSAEKSQVIPGSRSDIDPQTHSHVLERLLSTTAEAVENIPIFLELLDLPVKAMIWPSNERQWRKLFHITCRLLGDQSTLPFFAAWVLARTAMIWYNHKTADRQLCLILQDHLDSQKADEPRKRIPLNRLHASYLSFWFGRSKMVELLQTIAFLEPSVDADAELFWMVNTFHRTMQSEGGDHTHLNFFVAVLTYVSSTEQSTRSSVPLTAAVIYAMHTIRLALDQNDINHINRLFILPGADPSSDSVPMAFYPVAGIHAPDLWSEDIIQFVRNLLRWDWDPYWHHDVQLSLISALYLDSIKQAHARSTFATLLGRTRIKNVRSLFQGAYDHRRLAAYWYMALTQIPLHQDRNPTDTLYDVIQNVIAENSTLQLSGLRILEISVNYVLKTGLHSPDWIKRVPLGLRITAPDKRYKPPLKEVDPWVLLHLDTLFTREPEPYLLPEEVKELKWSDTPANAHIANARLDLYNSLANADHDGAEKPTPDPELLRVFLWSNDYDVCTRAFKCCVELASVSRPGPSGAGESTGVFIPGTIGHEWVGHFLHVLCKDSDGGGVRSWGFLESILLPNLTMLPSSWYSDFSLAFLFSNVQLPGRRRLPAYQFLANAIGSKPINQPKFLPFLETMLQLVEFSLDFVRISSLNYWLANIPERLDNQGARARIEHILATRLQTLAGVGTRIDDGPH